MRAWAGGESRVASFAGLVGRSLRPKWKLSTTSEMVGLARGAVSRIGSESEPSELARGCCRCMRRRDEAGRREG